MWLSKNTLIYLLKYIFQVIYYFIVILNFHFHLRLFVCCCFIFYRITEKLLNVFKPNLDGGWVQKLFFFY